MHLLVFNNMNKVHLLKFKKMKNMNLEELASKSARIAKDLGPDFITYMTEGEPQTSKEAMTSPEAPFWKEAINSETESIMNNNTWQLVDLPPSSKPIGFKWICKKKLKLDSSIYR